MIYFWPWLMVVGLLAPALPIWAADGGETVTKTDGSTATKDGQTIECQPGQGVNTKENKCEKIPEWEKLIGGKTKEHPKVDTKNSEPPPLQGLGRTDPIAAEMAAITHGQGPTVTNREPVRLGASDVHAEIAKNTPKLDYKTSSEAAAKAASGAEFNKDDKNDKALKMPTTAVQDFEKGKKDARDENFDNKELNRNPDYLAGALAGDKEALAEAARNKGGADAAAENKTKFSCQFGLCITQAGQDKIDAVAAQAQKERAAKALQEQQNQPKIQNAALTRQETSAQQTLSDPKRFVPTGIPVDNGEVRDQLGACRGGGCIRPHMGTDVGGAREAPVKATAAGVVIRSDCNDSGGYGCQTLIDHGNGYKTRYSHLTTNLPRVGSFVEKGQIISGIGYDTRSPHVHYEVLVDDSKVDIARQGITGIRQGSGKIGVAGMVAINPIQAESGLMAVARPSRFESAPVNTDLAGTLATAAVGTGGGRQYPAGRMSLGMGGGGTNYGGNYAGQNFGPYGNGSGNANNGGLMGLLSGFFGGGQPQDGQQGGIPGSTVGYPPTNPSPTNPSTDLTAAVTPLTNNSITPIKTAAVDCSKAVLGIDRILACGQAKPPTTVQTTTCGNNATAAASGLSTSGCAVVR